MPKIAHVLCYGCGNRSYGESPSGGSFNKPWLGERPYCETCGRYGCLFDVDGEIPDYSFSDFLAKKEKEAEEVKEKKRKDNAERLEEHRRDFRLSLKKDGKINRMEFIITGLLLCDFVAVLVVIIYYFN